MKKIISLFAFVFISLTLVACGNKESGKDTWEDIEKKKEVVIGFDNTFVPMGFKDEAGKNVGFDIDLAREVFTKYGIKVKMQPIEWSMKETELRNGSIDLIWNGYSATPQRKKQVLFSNPYMVNKQLVITKKSSKIKNLDQMDNKNLGAQEGSSGYDAFDFDPSLLKDNVRGGDAILYEGFNEALLDLKNDRIQGLLIDEVYADYYLNKNNEIKAYNFIDTPFKHEDFAVGARKADKTLINNINTSIKELHESGKFQEISKKWFSKDVFPK